MYNFLFRSIFIFFIFTLFFSSCSRINNKLPKEIINQSQNRSFKKRAELGKKLFFDPILSKNGKLSCASCHKPEHGFADSEKVSTGINNAKGERNTPTIYNTSRLKFLFWDGRAHSLEEQALGPIQNPIEMGETIENVLKKLNSNKKYKLAFKNIFGVSKITSKELAEAISDFERTVFSYDSDFDRYKSGNKNALSPSEKKGYELFTGKAMCIACHSGEDFTDGSFHNIGLDTEDNGRARVTLTKIDVRSFKTPTLREISNTAPYFHNGEFNSLEEVIAYYNAGGGEDENKDPLKVPLNLNESEQKNLVDFLKSLNGRQRKIKSPRI